MRCAVTQPTFLPWAGYFKLMFEVDNFVFLDDVQLSRQSWQTRNRILTGHDVRWVSVPVRHEALDQTIHATQIVEDRRWRSKICSQLRQGYARHPFSAHLESLLGLLEQTTPTSLAELNIGLIEVCTRHLAIATPCSRTSALPLGQTDRTKRLVEICGHFGCDTYVSPPGSADYLAEDGFQEQTDIALEFTDYHPPHYLQKGGGDFVSHLSIVDVVANLGWSGAAEYIRGPWPDLPSDSHLPIDRQET